MMGGSRVRRVLAPVVLTALLAAGGLVACEPSPPAVDKTKPILFLHGWALGSTDCGGLFDDMIADLRARGFTGPMVKVGSHDGNSNCDVDLHQWGNYDDGDSWKAIAKAFSSYVSTTWTSKGKAVDAVGYSMGALVVRGALKGASAGESGFAKPLDIGDFLSLGGPHAGAAWYSQFCLWGQCSTLKPGATDIKWLNQDLNPQGKNGTDSTVMGSDGDAVVPTASAIYMGVPVSNKVVYGNVPHTGDDNYMHDPTVLARSAQALSERLK